jgi:hypothetical protein
MRTLGVFVVIVLFMAVAIGMAAGGWYLVHHYVPGLESFGALMGFGFGLLVDAFLYLRLRTLFNPPLPE